MRSSKSQVQLIYQALSAANSSINLARNLLRELEKGTPLKPPLKELPAIAKGSFDGESLVTAEGKKYPVPENYASKSQLCYGDTLKLVKEDGKERFKQIERVKRQKVEGILTKKDGKWHAVTADGSYKVLEASIRFHGGKEGDEVKVVLPLGNVHVPFATFEEVIGKKEEKVEKKVKEEEKKEERKVVKKKPKKRAEKKKEEKEVKIVEEKIKKKKASKPPAVEKGELR